MGGSKKGKKKNCSGCHGLHKAPFGPNLCPYLKKSDPEDPLSVSSTPGTPPLLGQGTSGGDGQSPNSGDNADYISKLQSRIQQLETFHHQKDEEDRIRELELHLKSLELSAQQRTGRESFQGPCPMQGALRYGAGSRAGSGAGAGSGVVPVKETTLRGVPKEFTSQANIQPTFPLADQQEIPSFSPDEHGRIKKSNSKFRPEFHLDLHKSVDKYTFREYILGCLYVAEALVADGRPVAGYLSHVRFMAWKAAGSQGYQTQALIKYDQHLSTKVIRGSIPDWVLGEEEGMCLYLGVDGTHAFKQLTAVSRSGKGVATSLITHMIYAGCIIIVFVILLAAKGDMFVIHVKEIIRGRIVRNRSQHCLTQLKTKLNTNDHGSIPHCRKSRTSL